MKLHTYLRPTLTRGSSLARRRGAGGESISLSSLKSKKDKYLQVLFSSPFLALLLAGSGQGIWASHSIIKEFHISKKKKKKKTLRAESGLGLQHASSKRSPGACNRCLQRGRRPGPWSPPPPPRPPSALTPGCRGCTRGSSTGCRAAAPGPRGRPLR